jgi:membrane-bound ClpP family serine protease
MLVLGIILLLLGAVSFGVSILLVIGLALVVVGRSALDRRVDWSQGRHPRPPTGKRPVSW